MNCKQFAALLDDQLDGASPSLSSEAQEHLAACKRCRELYGLVEGYPVDPAVIESIGVTLRANLKPVSPLPSDRNRFIQFLALFAVVSIALTGMMGARVVRALTWWQITGMAAVLMTAAFLICRSLSRQMVPGNRDGMGPKWLLILLPPALALAVSMILPWGDTSIFVRPGLQCLETGILMALPCAGLFWLLARRGAVLALDSTVATTGALAGLVAVAVMQFNCRIQQAAHIAVWHVGVPVILSAFGFALGRALGPHSRRQS